MAIALLAFLGSLVIGLIGAGIYIIYTKLRTKEEEFVEHHKDKK